LKNSVFSKFNIVGDLLEFPFNDETEIFNDDEVIDAVKEMFDGSK
jgi:hypothetical protein